MICNLLCFIFDVVYIRVSLITKIIMCSITEYHEVHPKLEQFIHSAVSICICLFVGII